MQCRARTWDLLTSAHECPRVGGAALIDRWWQVRLSRCRDLHLRLEQIASKTGISAFFHPARSGTQKLSREAVCRGRSYFRFLDLLCSSPTRRALSCKEDEASRKFCATKTKLQFYSVLRVCFPYWARLSMIEARHTRDVV